MMMLRGVKRDVLREGRVSFLVVGIVGEGLTWLVGRLPEPFSVQCIPFSRDNRRGECAVVARCNGICRFVQEEESR